MSSRNTLLLPLAALLATACGPKPLTLPEDPVERAATCGVVAAANARSGQTDVKTPLTLEQQASILHYALLGGGEGKDFAQDRVAAVVQRMPELEGGITEGEWQQLVQPCREAYPATAPGKPIELPKNTLDARLSCYMLAEFLTKSLGQRVSDDPEVWRWADDGGSSVEVTLVNGRCSRWVLQRPDVAEEAAG